MATARRRQRYATIGTVSADTLKPDELADAFAGELAYLKGRGVTLPKGAAKLIAEVEASDLTDHDDVDDIIEELIQALNAVAPPFAYFGTHPSDGALYGFWPDFDAAEADGDVLRGEDTGDVPRNFAGFVLHVTDHGNATLYKAQRGARLTEIWSVV